MAYDAQHSVNVAECLALADFLEALPPKKFDMRNWCGTAACIAGWQACRIRVDLHDGDDAFLAVEKSLGLSSAEANELFSDQNSAPPELTLQSTTKKHAARVLRHLAATGEVDWSVAVEGSK